MASLLAVLGAWELYGRGEGGFATPPPSTVFPVLWDNLVQGGLLWDTAGTIWSVVVGMVVSVGVGLVLGFAIPMFPWARNTLDPLIDAVYAMPVTMLIPVIGVYTGLGFRGRVFIIFTYVAMIIVVNVSTGVRQIDPNLIETARSFGAGRLELWRNVTFPGALPYITSGISIGVARGVRGAITAELLLITVNLGGFILSASSAFMMDVMLAGIVWTLVLGYVLYAGAVMVERRLLRWRDP